MSPLDENSNLKYLGADRLTGIHVYEDKTTLEKFCECNGKLVSMKEIAESFVIQTKPYDGPEVDLLYFDFKYPHDKVNTIDVAEKEEPEEPELTPEEKQLALKQFQANCKHDEGYVTGTVGSTSKCVSCGKPWI